MIARPEFQWYVCIIKTTEMRLSLTFTLHYMIFISTAILLTPAKFSRSCEKINEIKIEKKQQASVARENTTELLHSEILFKY